MKGLLLFAALISTALASAQTADKNNAVKHVNATQAEKLISEQKVIVLDIRTPEEFKTGHISGATNIDFHAPDFEKTINTLPKTNAYLVHCAVGGRSTHHSSFSREISSNLFITSMAA